MARKFTCLCNFVSFAEIVSAVKEGASDLEDVKMLTGAGASCGKCHPAIHQILADTCENLPPDPQGRLF